VAVLAGTAGTTGDGCPGLGLAAAGCVILGLLTIDLLLNRVSRDTKRRRMAAVGPPITEPITGTSVGGGTGARGARLVTGFQRGTRCP
jgi:hypothetical protein